MSKLLRILAVGIVCLGLLSCTRDDPYFFLNPKLPVSVPFAMDKAGNKASIDFWAVPGKVKLGDRGDRYVIRFDFAPRKLDGDAIGFLEKTKAAVVVQAKVFLVNNQTETVISNPSGTNATTPNGDPAPPYQGTGDRASLAYARLICGGSRMSYVSVLEFQLPEYGHYRVDIETLQDQPAFESLNSLLVIDKRICQPK